MTTVEIVRWVIASFEGKLFTDDPVDSGGATKFGITLRTLTYYRRRAVTKADVRDLTLEEAVACGVQVFAIETRISQINDWRTRLVVFDYGFHSGAPRAVMALQSALRFSERDIDGVIGARTIDALADARPVLLPFEVLTSREEFMQRIMERQETQRRFMLGWWKRTTQLQRLLVTTEG